jgi:hypothetical protein
VPQYEAARERLEGVDDPVGRGLLLANLAATYDALGDYERSRSTSLEALELQERTGDEDGVAITTLNIASLELRAGNLDAAAAQLTRSLAASLRLGYLEVTAYGLGIAAELALARGRTTDAGILAGAFLELFAQVGSRPQAEEADRHERVVDAMRADLDPEPLLAEGRSRSLEDMVAVALDVAGITGTSPERG